MVVQVFGSPGTIINLPERFERKYFLTPGKVGLAYGLLRHICPPSEEYPSERINSLYFDTVDLDQYERSSSGDYHKDKVRIRWYGDDVESNNPSVIFIELKSRRGFASTKQRLNVQVPVTNLMPNNLSKGIVPISLLMETLARFNYFPSNILRPIIKISYWRYRFDEIMTAQRLSLDCHIRSTIIMPGMRQGEKELELPGGIIEIKGKKMELPLTLRQTRILGTDWSRFSKYSTCLEAHMEELGSIGRLSPSGKIVL